MEKRREAILTDMQSVTGPLPGAEKHCPLDVKTEDEVDCGKYIRRRITYVSEPHGRVPAFLLIPKAALERRFARRRCAVFAPHRQRKWFWHRCRVRRQGQPAVWRRTCGPWICGSCSQLSAPAKYQPELELLGWQSGTLKAVWDNICGLDLLDSLPFVKHGRFGAIGHSLGGHNSIFTAVFDERIAVVVSSSGLDSFLDYYGGDEKMWRPEQGWTQTRYMPKLANYRGRLAEIPLISTSSFGALAPRHVLIISPLRDSNFQSNSVDRIASAARPFFGFTDMPSVCVLSTRIVRMIFRTRCVSLPISNRTPSCIDGRSTC